MKAKMGEERPGDPDGSRRTDINYILLDFKSHWLHDVSVTRKAATYMV